MRKKVLVLGSNFGGMTAALAVRHELDGDVDVRVVSASDHFLFNPSLIWLPFGKRSSADITFPVAPTLEAHGIEFVRAAASRLDPVNRTVDLEDGRRLGYDYLVIATGYRNLDDVVPGFRENANTITTLPDAERTAVAWRLYLADPGDIVVAATQGAGCFGAAYEFLFNVSYQLRKAKLHDRVKLTYVTAEPFLGHFGIGGLPHGEQLLRMFLKKEGIDARISVAIDHIDDGAVVLADGDALPFAFSMVVPPFLGQEFLLGADGIADEKGYVRVRGTYQSEKYDDIYAVGVAAAVDVPWQTPTPVGIPKTGFPTEVMAHTAAANIAAQIRGEQPTETKAFGDIKAICVMDAGNNGVIGFEKYFLWKMRHGYIQLP
jgi:sulfide:quinone oxidoreductase